MHVGSEHSSDRSAVHSVHDFVDGSVATKDKNKIGAFADRLSRQFRCVTCFLGGEKPGLETRTAEGVNGTL